jgi:hypothetical protein
MRTRCKDLGNLRSRQHSRSASREPKGSEPVLPAVTVAVTSDSSGEPRSPEELLVRRHGGQCAHFSISLADDLAALDDGAYDRPAASLACQEAISVLRQYNR